MIEFKCIYMDDNETQDLDDIPGSMCDKDKTIWYI